MWQREAAFYRQPQPHSQDDFAIAHANQAIRLWKARREAGRSEIASLVLFVLLIDIELLRGNYYSAYQRIQTGFLVLGQWMRKHDQGLPPSAVGEDVHLVMTHIAPILLGFMQRIDQGVTALHHEPPQDLAACANAGDICVAISCGLVAPRPSQSSNDGQLVSTLAPGS